MLHISKISNRCYSYLGLLSVAILGVASIVGSGGGGSNGGTPPGGRVTEFPRYAFVANRGDDSVSSYVVDAATGRLKFIGKVTAGNEPASVAVDPSGSYAYVANFNLAGPGTVSQYTIESDGSLTAMTTPTVATGTQPASVTVDPTAKYAYVANSNSGDVSAYEIDPGTGALAQILCVGGAPACSGDNFAAGATPRSVTVDPSGKYVYVANQVTNDISQFTIEADGSLTAMTPATVAAGTEPWFVTVDPTGKYVYVANSGTTTVAQYSIGATGGLAAIGSDIAGASPRSAAVHPSGIYAYVANSGSDDVAQFTIKVDGTFEAMVVPKVEAGDEPFAIIVDPSGRYVYVANQGSDSISQFAVFVGGRLVPIAPASVATQSGPISLAMTGGSAPVQAVPKYAYVANSGTTTVSQFTIGADGSLTPMATPAVLAGTSPASVTVDPSGKYAYVANSGTTTVSQFAIGADGRLTLMTTPAVLAGTSPASVTTTGTWQ